MRRAGATARAGDRGAALAWLLSLPAIDLLVNWVGIAAPLDRYDGWPAALLALLAQIAFWLGAILFAWAISHLLRRLGRGPRLPLQLVWLTGLAAGHGYFLAHWGYIVANRRLPNPEAAVFLLDNASRVPHHLLQTAPLLSVAFVLASLGLTWISHRVLLRVDLPALAARPRRTLLAGLLCLLAAALAPGGIGRSHAAFALKSVSGEQLEALAQQRVGALAPRRDAAPVAPARRHPVIVILVESLRHDLLTTNPEAIPFLRSLHDQYIGFDYAYATASHSNLTDLAFWYGQYPLRGAAFERFPVDAAWRGTSLFKAFHDAGYPTAYVSSQNELWGNMHNWLKTPDVDFYFHSENHQGKTWENEDDFNGLVKLIRQGIATAGKVEDSETLATALRWVDGRRPGEGFLLGMNLQNTHFSYVMPPDAVEPYQPADLGFRAVYYHWPKEQREQVRNRYLNAVRNVDRLLERFVAELQRRGLWDECLFVVLGDNGEAFHEHGFGNHSGPMYDEVVRTLAVVKPPRSSGVGARRVAPPVSHIDIAASVPALAGLAVPASFQGLPAHLAGSGSRPAYMYSNAFVRQYGIVDWPWKLLLTEYPEERVELYRLDDDPDETRDLAAALPRQANTLRNRLGSWVATQRMYYAKAAFRDRMPPLYEVEMPFGMAAPAGNDAAREKREK